MSGVAVAMSRLHEVALAPSERAGTYFESGGSRGARRWTPAREGEAVPRLARPRLVEAMPATEATTWEHYLASLETVTGIGERHAGAARELWARLVESAGSSLRVPAAGPGGELGFYFAWNYKDSYVSIDIAPDGRLEWFWKDKTSGAFGGSEDDEVLVSPPEALIAALVRRCRR